MILNNVDDNDHFTEMILVEKNDNIIIHFLMKNNIRKEKILEKHKLLYSYKKKGYNINEVEVKNLPFTGSKVADVGDGSPTYFKNKNYF